MLFQVNLHDLVAKKKNGLCCHSLLWNALQLPAFCLCSSWLNTCVTITITVALLLISETGEIENSGVISQGASVPLGKIPLYIARFAAKKTKKHSRTTTTAWSYTQTEVWSLTGALSVTYRFRFLYSCKLKVDVFVCAPHTSWIFIHTMYIHYTHHKLLRLTEAEQSFPVFLCAVMRTMCL